MSESVENVLFCSQEVKTVGHSELEFSKLKENFDGYKFAFWFHLKQHKSPQGTFCSYVLDSKFHPDFLTNALNSNKILLVLL